MTTVCACEKTVVIVKQPGHLTSMKNERGAGTRFYGPKVNSRNSIIPEGLFKPWRTYLKLVLACLSGRSWVEKINCENLSGRTRLASIFRFHQFDHFSHGGPPLSS
jgi:hypothetical protein